MSRSVEYAEKVEAVLIEVYAHPDTQMVREPFEAGSIVLNKTEKKVDRLAEGHLPLKYAMIPKHAFKGERVTAAHLLCSEMVMQTAAVYGLGHITYMLVTDKYDGLVNGCIIKGSVSITKFA